MQTSDLTRFRVLAETLSSSNPAPSANLFNVGGSDRRSSPTPPTGFRIGLQSVRRVLLYRVGYTL